MIDFVLRRRGEKYASSRNDTADAVKRSEAHVSSFRGVLIFILGAMIAAARAEEMFWRDLKTDIAKKSIWGILHILAVLALGTLAVKFGIGSIFGITK